MNKLDRAYLSTESMVNKVNNKPSRKSLQKTKAELGNKEGKIMNKKEKFNYLFGWLYKLKDKELKSKVFKDKKKEK